MRERAAKAAAIALLAIGSCLAAYPVVSNALARSAQEETIRASVEAVATIPDESIAQMRDDALRYNEALAGGPVRDPFVPGSGYALPDDYQSVLNPAGDGVMATLRIPKIGLRLPVYHGTSEDVLRKGAGHLEQTALPIGEKGCRPVITGHRGLPQAELFTRLDELDEGDLLMLDVLGETHAYRVCSIEVIDPDDLESMATVPEKDLVTLMTCTPYGINTHRLLITGERCETPQEQGYDPHAWRLAPFMVIAAVTIAAAWARRRKRRHA